MTKEEFVKLGLDEISAEKAAAASAEELKDYVKKVDFDGLNAEKKQLDKDIAARDQQLEKLKKIDPAGLQEQIAALQKQNADDRAAYEAQLKAGKVEAALQLALVGARAVNIKAVRALIDLDPATAEFDDKGGIKGLTEQIKKLQEADDSKMLFAREKFRGFRPIEKRDGLPNTEDAPTSLFEAVKYAMTPNE